MWPSPSHWLRLARWPLSGGAAASRRWAWPVPRLGPLVHWLGLALAGGGHLLPGAHGAFSGTSRDPAPMALVLRARCHVASCWTSLACTRHLPRRARWTISSQHWATVAAAADQDPHHRLVCSSSRAQFSSKATAPAAVGAPRGQGRWGCQPWPSGTWHASTSCPSKISLLQPSGCASGFTPPRSRTGCSRAVLLSGAWLRAWWCSQSKRLGLPWSHAPSLRWPLLWNSGRCRAPGLPSSSWSWPLFSLWATGGSPLQWHPPALPTSESPTSSPTWWQQRRGSRLATPWWHHDLWC